MHRCFFVLRKDNTVVQRTDVGNERADRVANAIDTVVRMMKEFKAGGRPEIELRDEENEAIAGLILEIALLNEEVCELERALSTVVNALNSTFHLLPYETNQDIIHTVKKAFGESRILEVSDFEVPREGNGYE